MSVMVQPWASLINNGVPPTPLNARTGDETPPGINWLLRANAASDLAVLREDGMPPSDDKFPCGSRACALSHLTQRERAPDHASTSAAIRWSRGGGFIGPPLCGGGGGRGVGPVAGGG